MKNDPATAARKHDGTTFYFCAKGCVKTFESDPHLYGRGESHPGHSH